jgi:hypothetical protein
MHKKARVREGQRKADRRKLSYDGKCMLFLG